MKKLSIFLMMLCLACFGVAKAQTLNEGFEGSTFPPTDWTTIHVSGNNAWARGTGTGANSSSAFAYRKDVNGGYEDYLITPLLEPKSGEELSFYLASQYSANYAGTTLTIEVSNTTPEIASFTDVLATYTSGASGTFETTSASDWVNKTVGLSAYVGQQIYIAFHAKDTGYNADTRIDNVSGVSLFVPACPKPTNLEATTDGTTATLTWDGTADNGFDIEINGTPTDSGQTSPYTFNVNLATSYTVTVTANCGANGTSDPVSTSFTTPLCTSQDMCEITFDLTDQYGDTWNGNAINVVDVQTGTVVASITSDYNYYQATGSYAEYTQTKTLAVCDGREIQFVWEKGSYPGETSWVIYDINMDVITSGAGNANMATGDVLASYTVDCTVPTCLKPTDLAVTNITNESAVITWTAGGANQTSWNLKYKKTSEEKWKTVNGLTVATDTITGLEAGTEYEVQVQGNCGTDGLSDFTRSETFTTAFCAPADMCEISYELYSNYTDGWSYNGTSYLQIVDKATSTVLASLTEDSGAAYTEGTLAVCEGRDIQFQWVAGASYESQLVAGFIIYDAAGDEILNNSGVLSTPYTYTVVCPTCFKPTNLHTTDVTTESAKLNWDGTSASYTLKYRTAEQNINLVEWHQIGEDVTATATETTYNFDLSDYSGAGYVAIRHYNVTNMFYLDVANVTVTDSDGTTVLVSADGTSIPSDWTNQDVDGDGYVWTTSLISGYFVSQSYVNNYGPVTPDNWLIIPVSNLGGTLSFTAKGQDGSFPSEIFGVFVTTATLTDALQAIPAGTWSNEISTTDNYYPISGLTANTPYEWQVKGVCGTDDETSWATSTFTTIALGVKNFITEGNWNVANNWSPAGVPTIDDKVMISANVTVPAGVVATAKKITLNGGTLTIADGGQLKQNGNVELIIEKEIAGYGTGNGNWYFIASPLTTTRLTFVQDWSFVNALTGNYDLYAFDPTQTLEWINYRSNSSHAAFTSGNNNNVLVAKTGYLYGHEDYIKLQFEGSTAVKSNDNVETLDLTLDETSTDDFNGFTLVGNPFTCNTYITFVDASNNVLAAEYYVMNTEGNGFDIQASNISLAPCSGAIIDYSQVGSGKVQFNTEAPSGSKNGALDMNVTNGQGKVDMARVRFGEGLNLRKMSFRENSSKLYMSQNGEDFAVVYADNQGEMPVSFKAAENGTYTISFNTENVEFGYLHLIDNMTGTDVDLLANPSYTFNANTNDYASRFRLMFAAGSDDNNFAFVSNGEIILNGQGTVQVYDVTGRMISSHNDVTSIATDGLSAGVYMLRLINGSDIKTQKIVVK